MARHDVLVSVSDLAVRLDEVDLLDVRWRLGEPAGAGRERYREAHLPGAAFLDLETVLTRHGEPIEGRHPLPDAETLAFGLATVGVDGSRLIVVYDEPGSFAAGRAWWVLTWAGLDVRVLDGGVTAWTAAGLPTESGVRALQSSTPPALRLGSLPIVDADQAAALPANGVLIDARAAERFRGEVEPIDPRPGHIPGAVNIPVGDFWDADGRLPDDEALAGLLAPARSGGPVAVYCGSGVSAAQLILALRTQGVEAALFPGSWSAWANDPARPAQLGG